MSQPDIPLRRILSDIITAGYDGVFDLELIGPRIEEEGYERAIRRAIETTSALLDSPGLASSQPPAVARMPKDAP